LSRTDDAPELTDEWFAETDLYKGAKVVSRGQPRGSGTKELVSLKLDKQALAALRSTGPGWPVRINETVVRSAKQRAGSADLDSFPGFLSEASAGCHAAAGSCCGM
jgi:uncharacterized protein (DUF4415 family)